MQGLNNAEKEIDENNSNKANCLTISLQVAKEALNFKQLLNNRMLLFVTISNFFIFFVYFIPFIYIPIRAEQLGITQYAWVFSVIG